MIVITLKRNNYSISNRIIRKRVGFLFCSLSSGLLSVGFFKTQLAVGESYFDFPMNISCSSDPFQPNAAENGPHIKVEDKNILSRFTVQCNSSGAENIGNTDRQKSAHAESTVIGGINGIGAACTRSETAVNGKYGFICRTVFDQFRRRPDHETLNFSIRNEAETAIGRWNDSEASAESITTSGIIIKLDRESFDEGNYQLILSYKADICGKKRYGRDFPQGVIASTTISYTLPKGNGVAVIGSVINAKVTDLFSSSSSREKCLSMADGDGTTELTIPFTVEPLLEENGDNNQDTHFNINVAVVTKVGLNLSHHTVEERNLGIPVKSLSVSSGVDIIYLSIEKV